MIVAGIGFSSNASAAEIVALVRRAEGEAGRMAESLAAPDFKGDAAALHEAAQALRLPVRLLDREMLAAAQARCATQSPVAAKKLGLASVAEACALVAAGENSHLLVARLAQGNVTCAIAGDLP
ncbi:MAG TPA: cobalamin biosynthesis protein [Acidocella sp.]|jgi:cobalt-precorrin 5A hydrolase|nr:cobalamin biosynthesis protein [Acidocella sp.]